MKLNQNVILVVTTVALIAFASGSFAADGAVQDGKSKADEIQNLRQEFSQAVALKAEAQLLNQRIDTINEQIAKLGSDAGSAHKRDVLFSQRDSANSALDEAMQQLSSLPSEDRIQESLSKDLSDYSAIKSSLGDSERRQLEEHEISLRMIDVGQEQKGLEELKRQLNAPKEQDALTILPASSLAVSLFMLPVLAIQEEALDWGLGSMTPNTNKDLMLVGGSALALGGIMLSDYLEGKKLKKEIARAEANLASSQRKLQDLQNAYLLTDN